MPGFGYAALSPGNHTLHRFLASKVDLYSLAFAYLLGPGSFIHGPGFFLHLISARPARFYKVKLKKISKKKYRALAKALMAERPFAFAERLVPGNSRTDTGAGGRAGFTRNGGFWSDP
jgi:hypothetical protein